jgi:PhnB protein
MKVIPYLAFDGNAEEAMNYYKEALNGEIVYIMRYGDNDEIPVSEAYKKKIMHGQVKLGEDLIYFSDMREGDRVTHGNHMEININFDSVDQLEKAYNLLKVMAKEISMELQDTFWNAKFASLIDQFGIGWSLNYSYPEE